MRYSNLLVWKHTRHVIYTINGVQIIATRNTIRLSSPESRKFINRRAMLEDPDFPDRVVLPTTSQPVHMATDHQARASYPKVKNYICFICVSPQFIVIVFRRYDITCTVA